VGGRGAPISTSRVGCAQSSIAVEANGPRVGMTKVAEDVPDVSDLRGAVEAERLWVTQVGAEVAGYIAAEVLDGNAHVAQVSVARDFAGRALGRAMIEFVEQWGADAGRPATTLTTFRDVPWNGPYYRRLGYRVLLDPAAPPLPGAAWGCAGQ
jgi:GNAT superfamily N-acetyltransferase